MVRRRLTPEHCSPELKLWPAIGFLLLAVLLLDAHGLGQAPVSPPWRVIQQSTLPAVDRGVMVAESRAPGSPRARALETLASDGRAIDRVGVDGRRYRAGRVLVKFRGAMDAAGRSRAVREASRS